MSSWLKRLRRALILFLAGKDMTIVLNAQFANSGKNILVGCHDYFAVSGNELWRYEQAIIGGRFQENGLSCDVIGPGVHRV